MRLDLDKISAPAIRRSYVIAGGIFLLLVVYVASGIFGGTAKNNSAKGENAEGGKSTKANEISTPMVRVRTIMAETRRQDLVVRGQSEALRKVLVRAETAGKVSAVRADRGKAVKAGDTICELKVDERLAMLKQARAVMKQRRLEYDASKQLKEKGFRSDTAVAGDQAEFEAANAQVERMEKELQNTKLKAPFDGVVDARMVDVGDYLAPGQPCALVIDQDPFLVVGQASEKDVGAIHTGDVGWAKLVTGERVDGKVRFISKSADLATRTFRVELEVSNKDGAIRDGVTAEMHITGEQVEAHRISPAILTLDEKNAIGVRIVDAGKRVRFMPVTIVAEAADGVWISGLPKSVMIITVGQDYVTIGQEVRIAEDKVAQP
ncbi:MAG: efflux RND transporter periplasmic adaptor subunit [Alphaproteobacteria bacterium]|nr:efflux RND transporter periplasmic adaptor subunit [Alphaproteobacteria bacterium]